MHWLLLSTLILGCNSGPKDNRNYNFKETNDTTTNKKSKEQNSDLDYEQVNLDTVLAAYQKLCSDTFKIDTSIEYKGRTLHIQFLHFSSNDSLIELPEKYIEFYKVKKFITHNFISSLKVKSGDSTLFNSVIKKDRFNQYVNEEELAFGTILYPTLKFRSDGISITYSYSIPLTDIGLPVSFEYKYLDKTYTKGGY
jgi:hypothetical protein